MRKRKRQKRGRKGKVEVEERKEEGHADKYRKEDSLGGVRI